MLENTMRIEATVDPDYGDLPIPRFQRPCAAVALYAMEDAELWDGEPTFVRTGLHLAIPEGFMGMIRSRSGLAAHRVTVFHGTIDSGYRGEIKALLTFRAKLNFHVQSTDSFFRIDRGMRVAQLAIVPVLHFGLSLVDELPPSVRGTGGFGSTGL